MTVAFVFCSVFIYGFSWNQPQNVEYPVFIEVSDAALAADETASATDTKAPATDETKAKEKFHKSTHAEDGGETGNALLHGGRASCKFKSIRFLFFMVPRMDNGSGSSNAVRTLCLWIRSYTLLGLELVVPNIQGTTCLAHLLCNDNRCTHSSPPTTSQSVLHRVLVLHICGCHGGTCIRDWADYDYCVGIHESSSPACRRVADGGLEQLHPPFRRLRI